jgi:hypothetical protein
MSKIQKPFGRVAKRITIEVDDNGTIRVAAYDIPLIATAAAKMTPMDSREMVLALMKVNMDYTSALFGTLTLKTEGSSTDGKQASQDTDTKQQQPN